MPIAIDAKHKKRKNHQYSEREARPSNNAYFEKQVLMESPKVMLYPHNMVYQNSKKLRLPCIEKAEIVRVEWLTPASRAAAFCRRCESKCYV